MRFLTRQKVYLHNAVTRKSENYRKYDIILLRNLEKVLPKKIIEMFYGEYQWCANSRLTYRNYFKSIKK